MRPHRILRWTAPAAVTALAIGAVALGGLDGGAGGDRPTEVTAVPPARLDWLRPVPVDLGGGWAVADTEGDAPMVTVLRNGRPVGIVEYLDFGLEEPATGDRATLDAHMAEYVRDIGNDRATAPVKDYRFDPDPAVHLRAADGAAVRYGFRGTLSDGRPSERSVHWAGIRGGRLVIVAASAYDEGGLFAREGSEFTSADLDAVAERLDALVRASGLPEPARDLT